MARVPATHPTAADAEVATGDFGDEPEDDDEETDAEAEAPEDEDGEIEDGETGADAYAKLEKRLTTRMGKLIAKREKRQQDSLAKFRTDQQGRLQAKLDEFALSTGSTDVSDPAAVRESLERQAKAFEAKLTAVHARMAQLTAAS